MHVETLHLLQPFMKFALSLTYVHAKYGILYNPLQCMSDNQLVTPIYPNMDKPNSSIISNIKELKSMHGAVIILKEFHSPSPGLLII